MRTAALIACCLAAASTWPAPELAQSADSILIRGKPQAVHVYGQRGQPPIVVSSGDGGWIHLAPHVAEVLASHAFFVAGIDAKAYLSSFTSRDSTLRPQDEPRDYRVIASYAAAGSSRKPILVGVSEGAGLSVLAATDPETRKAIGGVIGLGLPDLNELGWRWKDSLIYLTHGIPNEPVFSTQAIVGRIAPTPLAAIHSLHDEFVPLAEVQRVIDKAAAPKRLWVVNASDHRFSDNLSEFDRRLLEAVAWVQANGRE